MAERPYTLLSCSMSIDGYLDTATAPRLLLSNADDFDRVDAIRASCDAILVGATTVRKDNPRLLVRSADRRAERIASGLSQSPIKVTVTRHGRPGCGGELLHPRRSRQDGLLRDRRRDGGTPPARLGSHNCRRGRLR